MQIEHLQSAIAHIISEHSDLTIEADVTINGLQASVIENGRIFVTEEEAHRQVADFSSYTGSTHVTIYGEPTAEEQVALINKINAFCTDIRVASFNLVIENPWN